MPVGGRGRRMMAGSWRQGQNCLGSALSSKSSNIQPWHIDSIIIYIYVVKDYIVNSIYIAITLINKVISPKRPQITVIFQWVRISLIKEFFNQPLTFVEN